LAGFRSAHLYDMRTGWRSAVMVVKANDALDLGFTDPQFTGDQGNGLEGM